MQDSAQPYCGPAPGPSDWAQAWNFDPVLLAALGACAGAGMLALRHVSGFRQRSFGLAGAFAVLAFVSPLCAMTVALFSARTLHHLVVFSLLAPALALALPLRRIPPGLALAAVSAALWLWHLPVAYAAAWDSAAIYWAMQAALLLSAWAFWSALLARPALGNAMWLLPLIAQMGLLGAVLTFAPAPFYAEHLATTQVFGTDALRDQQLAGLIMWVPGMVPLAVLSAVFGWRALAHEVRA